MKSFVIALATAAIIATGAHAQNSRVLEPEARPGQPTVGPPQTTDPRTTTGQGTHRRSRCRVTVWCERRGRRQSEPRPRPGGHAGRREQASG
jgi:hypothetical protein